MIASKSRMPVTTRLLTNIINKRPLGSVATTTRRRMPAKHSHEYAAVSYPRQRHNLSTVASTDGCNNQDIDDHQPTGELFESKQGGVNLQNLVGKTASIGRVFGSRANAQGLLTCGGEELARHASFDPDYSRARGWIQNRAIGPAVLSPVLISGLVGALVEAALPQSVPIRCSMHQVRPLIVGVEVCARIEVTSVKENHTGADGGEAVSSEEQSSDFVFRRGREGYDIELQTEVIRVQDDAVIAKGSHSVWIPTYLSM